MKMNYNKPILDIIEFSKEDLITVSGTGDETELILPKLP